MNSVQASFGRLVFQARIILGIRAVRVFCDSFIALMIPLYLTARGFDAVAVGTIASCMLLGSAFTIGAAGVLAHRVGLRVLLCVASLSMVVSGIGWSLDAALPSLFLIAFFGSLNPHGGEANLFRPIEHAALAELVPPASQTTVFGYYSFIGAMAGALGALSIGVLPAIFDALGRHTASTAIFLGYAVLGGAVLAIYARLGLNGAEAPRQRALAPGSRGRVAKLTAIFCVDAFGGGFVVNALIILWLTSRFGTSVAESGALFFTAGVMAAAAQLFAAPISRRIGLGGTMLIGHVPSSLLLIGAAMAPTFGIAAACLILRGFLSQLDVPTRAAFVFSQVAPVERAAAISLTLMPFSLAAAAAPFLSGWLLQASSTIGWHLLAAGVVRLVYAVLFFFFVLHHRIGDIRPSP
ncbi:MAG: MFS transporter [Rhizobiaceae bacterium]